MKCENGISFFLQVGVSNRGSPTTYKCLFGCVRHLGPDPLALVSPGKGRFPF